MEHIKSLVVIFLIIFVWTTNVLGQTDSVKISLLTYSPLSSVSAAFGHTGLRVQNFSRKTDVIYNYGIYDSYEENFILKFLRGKLQYQIGKQATRHTSKGNRQIVSQTLLLTPEESMDLIAALETNYLPENRKYYYDFFFDNCATRIRDLIESTLGARLEYTADNTLEEKTLRQMLDVHVASRPWTDFGMDLLIGVPSDAKASFRDQMFLPAYLANNLEEAAIVKRKDTLLNNIVESPLLSAKNILVDGNNYVNSPHFCSPFVLFGILCLVVFLLTLLLQHHQLLLIDSFIYFVLGIVGLILGIMWVATDHDATQWNLNLIWANPLYLLLFISLYKGRLLAMKIAYSFAFFSSIILLLTWGNFFQEFHIGVLPIIVLMLVRSGSAFLYFKNE